MFGVPVVDTAQVAISIVKVTLFLAFATVFFSYMDVAVSILTQFIQGAFGGLTDFSSLNLGCISTKLGLVDFLNALLSQFYIVAGLTISAIGSLLTTKYVLLFFSFLMRV